MGINMLHRKWKPDFGSIVRWHAIDKNGKLACFINNCFGGVPKQLLNKHNINELKDNLNGYLDEESEIYSDYFNIQDGGFILDLFDSYSFSHVEPSREKFIAYLNQSFLSVKNLSDVSFVVNKGMFLYYGIECFGNDGKLLVNYNGAVKVGDYYRFLIPTKYSHIGNFPANFREAFAISNKLDFEKDRVLDKDINEYFEYEEECLI